MNITKNQFDILAYVEREGGKKITQRQLADTTQMSLGTVNKTVTELTTLGAIEINEKKDMRITRIGLEALEPYRVKRAVIIAAGFGSRMVPITLNTPKPLVRVHGQMIISTLLEAIDKAGIKEVIIVRGYLWEQFDVLKRQYPHIEFVYNPIYNEANNISSALLVRDKLCNAYVCEADLLVNNPAVIRKYEYSSNYLGQYRDYTDDWCFIVKKGYIRELVVGGTNCYHMYGISYWNEEDGRKLESHIEQAFKMPGGKERYWDEVALRIFSKEYNVEVRPCFEGDVIEIDTFTELKSLDKSYDV